MVEAVDTGGVKRFVYGKEDRPTLSAEQKKEIEDAYRRADERKENERRRRKMFWIIGILLLVVLTIAGLFFFR